jgi:hypothetical protein
MRQHLVKEMGEENEEVINKTKKKIENVVEILKYVKECREKERKDTVL